jgi:RNA polymerase sigma factor FliA
VSASGFVGALAARPERKASTTLRSAPEGTREELIKRYAPLVKYVVGRLGAVVPGVFDHQDAMQAGSIGLLQAIDNYRPDGGASFESYAFQRIRGAILDAVREVDSLGRAAREQARSIERAMSELEVELGRPADEAQIANRLGLTIERYRRQLETVNVVTIPIEELEPRGEDEPAVGESLVDSEAIDPAEAAVAGDTVRELGRHVGTLPERQQMVLSLYYREGLTFREIGELLSVTESRACQIHAEAVLRLRSRLVDPATFERLRRRPRAASASAAASR